MSASGTPVRPPLGKQSTPTLDTPSLEKTGTVKMPTATETAAQGWGKLISLVADKPHIILTKDKTSIGRSAECDHVISGNSFISSVHCTLFREPHGVILVDSSSNGTFLNGVRVTKNEKVPLPAGSELTLVPSKAGAEQVAFVLQVADGAIAAKPAAPVKDGMEANLVCCICTCIIHDCVSLVPCLHSFCGACFSEWENHSKECPQCRAKVEQVSRNPTVNNLAEAFLEAHPDRRRPADELKEMDEKNKYTGDKMRERDAKKPKRRRIDDDDDDDDEDEDGSELGTGSDSDDGPETCRSCLAAATADGYVCPPRAVHEHCMCCRNPVPDRPLATATPQRCAICNAFYCSLYWGCAAGSGCRGCLARVRDVRVEDAELERIVNNNSFETKVLQDFLTAKGFTPSDLFQQCVTRAQAGEFRCTVAPVLRPEMACCRNCVRRILQELAYQYREKIKPEDLPGDVRGRANCWYGRNCKTQHHKEDHAKRLNHVCNATR